MADHDAVSKTAIVSHDRIKDWLYRQLYSAIHVQRRITAEQLAVDSGVPIASIRSYMKGTAAERKEPCLSYAMSIAVVLGRECINSLLAEIGYGGATPLDEPDAPKPAEIVASGLQHFAVIASAASNGVFEPHEQDPVRLAADGIIATVLPLSSAGGAA